MGFLLAKILFVLVLAAACGALFGYWWFRRHYEDVTLEYARSRDEWASWRRGFEARLARSEEHTSELQSQSNLVCRLLLEKKKPLRLVPHVPLRISSGSARPIL